jgi:protoporphyrinogen oxidase
LEKDNTSWGPNQQFRFPRHGGTGAIWKAITDILPEGHIACNRRVVKIDPRKRTVTAEDGSTTDYDVLVTTATLCLFAARMIRGRSG